MTLGTSSSWCLNILVNGEVSKGRHEAGQRRTPLLALGDRWLPRGQALHNPPGSKGSPGAALPAQEGLLGQKLAGKWHSRGKRISHGKIQKAIIWLV